MAIEWQKLRVPLLERLALLDMAERRGETEEEALKRIIREAVLQECARPDWPRPLPAQPQGVRDG